MRTLLSALAVIGLLATTATAQVAPYLETFDGATATTTASCSITAPGTLVNGWAFDLVNGTNTWRVDNNGTTSSSTGPSSDHTTGVVNGGNYLFTETSGCPGWDSIVVSPNYDATSFGTPAIDFWYHMYGATMGTLDVQWWDGAAWQSAGTISGDQGNQWVNKQLVIGTYLAGAELQVRFVGTAGTSFTSDMAIDDVSFVEAPAVLWQTNSGIAQLDINGVQADAFLSAAIVNQTWVNCPPTATPATGTMTFHSDDPSAPWNIAFNSSPLVPLFSGATLLPDAQLVNLDFGGGVGLMVPDLGGTAAPFVLPGQTSYTVTMPYSVAANVDLSLQGYAVNVACFAGYCLTQGVELHVVLDASSTIGGPTTDDGTLLVDVTAAPTCWIPGGVPFYGTTYTQVGVNANGRMMFGGVDTDWTSSVTEFLGDNPSVGYWCDLDPSNTGNIDISNPAPGVLRVDYTNVAYRTELVGVTFSIEVDANTGNVTMDGLQGIPDNPLAANPLGTPQLLGLSGGNAVLATDPGATAFGVGGGLQALLTDAWYEINDPSVSLVGGLPSIAGGLNTLQFVPNGFGYDWTGSL